MNDTEIITKELTLSLGPQHPAAHGVLHLILDMQGEVVTRAEPDIGYLHRGTVRISGHLVCVGAWGIDLGAMTVLLYTFREREMILDLFEMLCGARVTVSYLRVGGLPQHATKGV